MDYPVDKECLDSVCFAAIEALSNVDEGYESEEQMSYAQGIGLVVGLLNSNSEDNKDHRGDIMRRGVHRIMARAKHFN